jgi:hypothetical protein
MKEKVTKINWMKNKKKKKIKKNQVKRMMVI